MARLLTGVTRARTMVRPAGPEASAPSAPAPVRDSVAAPPRPGVGPDAGSESLPGADGPDSWGAAPDDGRPGDAGPGADPDAGVGSGRGGLGRFLPGRGGGDRSGFDVRNSWQVIAGSFLVPAGVVIILIAWYGAAHTRYVQQQIPYLVSGAFIGLGCMVLGGLLYWAHWLYRIYDQADLNHEEMMKAFEQTLRVVADRLTTSGGQGPGAGAGVGGFVATATGSVYHVPSCPVVAHHGEGLRSPGPDELAAMEPCRICLTPRRTLGEP